MAAGIDVAGLALAVFPLVVSTIEWYGGRVRSSDIKPLAQSLKTNQQIFLDSLEHLLRDIVSTEDLQVLLREPGGEAWRKASLNDKVMEHLGDRTEGILANVNDIYQTILKLNKKLPEPKNDTASDKSILDRGKLVIKAFFHGKRYHASLERLRARVDEFQKLTKGAITLASTRCTHPDVLKNLELVQECASGLYDAVEAGWKCSCVHPHPTNIKLDVWCTREQHSDDIRLQFSLLFADDAEDAHDDHWMTAEITCDKTKIATARSDTVYSGTTATSKTISLSVTGSTSNTSPDDPEHVEDLINNLCALLKNLEEKDLEDMPKPKPTRRRRHGSISDPAKGHSYDLLSKAEEPQEAANKSSVTLGQLFNRETPLTMKSRVQLGLTLAWAVLQISSTNWFSGKWTKDNILLVMDVQGTPKPYVSHRFEASGRKPRSPTMVPTTENEVADWIRNASLFALGVFLIELCYNKSIEDLATEKEKKYVPMTSLLTATRLAKRLHEELGVHYEQAVTACLCPTDFGLDKNGNPKDSSQFAKSMMKNIIEPLKTVAEKWFEK